MMDIILNKTEANAVLDELRKNLIKNGIDEDEVDDFMPLGAELVTDILAACGLNVLVDPNKEGSKENESVFDDDDADNDDDVWDDDFEYELKKFLRNI